VTGVRAEQLERTKAALEQAALRLFSERGYDATCVADIADAAGVTERTFFRHFATKDAVLFHRSRAHFDVLGAALVAHIDAAHPTWDAIQRALETYATEIQSKVGFDVMVHLVLETRTLEARRREHRSLWQEWAAEVLAASGGSERASHLAPIVLAVLNRGEEIWSLGDGEIERAEAMRRAVAEAKDASPRG
jgi:AcrR family transcriptional regulator